jgi:hypothetical protein
MRSCFCLAAALTLAVSAGCSNPNAPASLSGKVTYNGAPVTGGTITFAPTKEGGAFNRPIEQDGSYTMPDMAAGDYTVAIETESINPDKPKKSYGPPGQAGAAAGSTPPGNAMSVTGKYVKIDPKFADAKTSGLTYTVAGGGKQTKDWPLTGS